MFKTALEAPDRGASITVSVNGAEVEAFEGETVASLLLRFPEAQRRTPVSGSVRAPYCMMGVCFDCLVKVDGASSSQGCLIPVRPGMRIERQGGIREVAP